MRGNQAGWGKKARPDPVFTPVTSRECKRIRRPWRWYKSALGRPVQARVDMARNGGSKLGGTVLSIQRDRRLMRLGSVLVPGEPLPFQQGNSVRRGRDMCGDQASRWQEARPDPIFGPWTTSVRPAASGAVRLSSNLETDMFTNPASGSRRGEGWGARIQD